MIPAIARFLPLRILMVIVVILLFSGCSSPDSNDDDDETATPVSTATSPAATTSTATSAPEPTPPSATSTPTAPSPATATPSPTPLAPSATPTATAEPTATEPPPATPTNPPASADDVWTVRQFETDEPVIVLTFDAGADRGYAADILDILAAEGIHASFGMTGPWAVDNMDLVQRMVDEGHHVMNHSWSHPHFPELTSAERFEEVQSLENLLRDELGIELQPYFRPPFGEYDEATLADLATMGYTVNVMWTVDTLGWNGLSAAEINARVMDAAAPGAIVLMHVGAQSEDALALPDMIAMLREAGYGFATAEELAGG